MWPRKVKIALVPDYTTIDRKTFEGYNAGTFRNCHCFGHEFRSGTIRISPYLPSYYQ